MWTSGTGHITSQWSNAINKGRWPSPSVLLVSTVNLNSPSLPHHYLCTVYYLDQCYKSHLLFCPEDDAILPSTNSDKLDQCFQTLCKTKNSLDPALSLHSVLTTSLAKWLRCPPQERKVRSSNPACDGIFPGWVIPVIWKLALQWLPCQAPGIIRSVLGLASPVSVYCDWAR